MAQVLRSVGATVLLKFIKRAHRCEKEIAMDWDMLLVTGALIGAFMLIALLGRIWQDQTPREPEDEAEKSCEFPAPSVKLDRVA